MAIIHGTNEANDLLIGTSEDDTKSINSKKQFMNWTKASVALTATLMFTTASPASTYASSQKVYSGSMCDAPDLDRAEILKKTSSGTALNTSTSTTINYIVCPVVRENVNGSIDPPVAFIRVKNTNSVTTTCWFEAFNSDGQYHDINESSFTGVGTRTLRIPLTKPTQGGNPYQIECSLPPSSSIILYNVVETEGF